MRLALVLAALAAVPLKAEEPIAPDWASSAGRPAFQAVQSIADGVFDLASGGVFKPLLPDALGARLDASPDGDSYDAFSARLSQGEQRAARLDLETRPPSDAAPETAQAWGRAALAAHGAAALDALAGTMADRYGLPRFGRSASDYALDSRNWNADAIAPGILLGGAYAYLAGVRAEVPAGPVAIGINLAPGNTLRAAAAGDCGRRLARVAVSPLGSPLSLYAEWSARSPERVGTSWSKRF